MNILKLETKKKKTGKLSVVKILVLKKKRTAMLSRKIFGFETQK